MDDSVDVVRLGACGDATGTSVELDRLDSLRENTPAAQQNAVAPQTHTHTYTQMPDQQRFHKEEPTAAKQIPSLLRHTHTQIPDEQTDISFSQQYPAVVGASDLVSVAKRRHRQTRKHYPLRIIRSNCTCTRQENLSTAVSRPRFPSATSRAEVPRGP